MEETEVWKDVGIVRGIDFTGYFEASTFGNVRSLDRTVECKDGKTKNIKGKTLNPKTYPNGYLFVELSRNGRTIPVLVHRLVLQTFKPNPNPELYPCVNHKYENKTNNHLCNLEWCDYQYNNNYGSHAKRRLESFLLRFIPIVQLDFDGNIINVYYSTEEINKTKVYKPYGITQIINCQKYIYQGYFWIRLNEYNELTQNELLNLIKSTKRKTQRSQSKHKDPIVILDRQGKFVKQVNSIKEAASFIGCNRNLIYQVLSKDKKSVYGYKVIHLRDYQNQNCDV